MYKSFTASHYKSVFNFPENYTVAGLLTYGSWAEERYFEKLHSILKEMNIEHSSRKLEGFLGHIYEITINDKIYWFALQYGGAMLSEYVHLACLFGSKKNIHIGSCGGLYPEMSSLDILIPNWSFGNDSVTRTYARDISDNKHFPNEEISKFIKEQISIPNKVWVGPIMNCQAMMGETFEDVQSWSNDGFYGVEMETSTLFSVSNHHKVPCAAVVYVSDNLIKGQTVNDESHKAEKELREEAKNEVYRVGIKAIL